MAGQEGVPYGNYTVGTGIIGSIAAEGGLLALLVYSTWMGVLIRFFDELTITHIYNPFAVAITATGLGQLVGLPRGETGSFAALLMIAFISSLIICGLISWFASSIGLVSPSYPQKY